MSINYTKYLLTVVLVLFSINHIETDEAVNPVQPRQCYSCEGINCQRTTKTNVTSDCSDLLDICVTIFDGFAVAAKGCYLDMPNAYRSKCDTTNNPECTKCFGQLCNNKGRADFKCIECDSTQNSKCATDTSDMIPVQCTIPTAPNSYCYVRSTDTNAVSRGCYGNVIDQLDCMQNGGCSMCLSQDGGTCNSYELTATPKSGGMRAITLSFGVIFVLLGIQLIA